MPVRLTKCLQNLRSTRDLRAGIVDLGAELAGKSLPGALIVTDPVISEAAVHAEWERLLPAFDPSIQDRMNLEVRFTENHSTRSSYTRSSAFAPLDRPNFRFEVLRLLLGANLEGRRPQTVRRLMDTIGASQTPIRQALSELQQGGLCRSTPLGFEAVAEDISLETLGRAGALPQTLRFRFERGAQIMRPDALLDRALSILGPKALPGWDRLALSGTVVAVSDVPRLDLLGTPRLDLVAHVPRSTDSFDTDVLRLLDDGLELEPSVLAPAPVVVTVVRAETRLVRSTSEGQQSAIPADVFYSLLDLGLRAQAIHYAQALLR